MTSKNNSLTAVSDVLLTAPAEKTSGYKPLSSTRPLATQQYLYFTETNTDRILDNLDGLRDMVFPRPSSQDGDGELRNEQEFPSVCLIGLGRCGSNIALDVAELVYNARKFYLNEFSTEDKTGDKGYSPAQWIRNNLRLGSNKGSKPVFLVEPLVMLGDLDKDIAGRIRFSRKGEKSGFLRDYSKMRSWTSRKSTPAVPVTRRSSASTWRRLSSTKTPSVFQAPTGR